MKFILTGLGNWYAGWQLIKEAVAEADRLGFGGVVLPDQYMWNPEDLGANPSEPINSTLDTWVALTYLAARTETIRLGTWVTPVPLRAPGILAKIVSTLDVISDGRAVLGVGAGDVVTLDAYGEADEPSVQVDKTEEALELILRLWAEDKVSFHGRYYRAKDAVLEPKPLQKPHPPLLFGGAGKRMLKLAGRHADICYIPPWIGMSHAEARGIVLREAKKLGRESMVSFAADYTPLQAPNYDFTHYDSKQFLSKVEEAKKNGCSFFIVAFPTAPPWLPLPAGEIQYELDCSRDFARNIIPSFSD